MQDQPTFSAKVDIWALGCVYFEVIMGYKLFESDWSAKEYSRVGDELYIQQEHSGLPQRYHRKFQRLLQLMIHANPDMRPTSGSVLQYFDRQVLLS
jgi:serine/threonine protein kinase